MVLLILSGICFFALCKIIISPKFNDMTGFDKMLITLLYLLSIMVFIKSIVSV